MTSSAILSFPTRHAVEFAGVEEVLRWNRFLPSPRSDEQVDVIRAIVLRLEKLRAADIGAYVAASKRIGWGDSR